MGDVVKLKSGSPWMTVTELWTADNKVQCSWFGNNDQSQIRSAVIAQDALVEVPAKDLERVLG